MLLILLETVSQGYPFSQGRIVELFFRHTSLDQVFLEGLTNTIPKQLSWWRRLSRLLCIRTGIIEFDFSQEA